MRHPFTLPLSCLVTVLAMATVAAEPSSKPVTRTPVILTTRTPLGEARIELPAGSPIDSNLVSDQKVFVSRPPFSAWIPLKSTTLMPDPKASPSPLSSPEASRPPASSPQNPATLAQSPALILPGWVRPYLVGDGHIMIAAGILVFLACGSIVVSLICFLLLKNRYFLAKITPKSRAEKEMAARHAIEIKNLNKLLQDEKTRAREEMELVHAAMEQVQATAKKATDELEAIRASAKSHAENLQKEVRKAGEFQDLLIQRDAEIVSLRKQLEESKQRGTGRAGAAAATPPAPGMPPVNCPLCQSLIAFETLSLGTNVCPSCKGEFNCE